MSFVSKNILFIFLESIVNIFKTISVEHISASFQLSIKCQKMFFHVFAMVYVLCYGYNGE